MRSLFLFPEVATWGILKIGCSLKGATALLLSCITQKILQISYKRLNCAAGRFIKLRQSCFTYATWEIPWLGWFVMGVVTLLYLLSSGKRNFKINCEHQHSLSCNLVTLKQPCHTVTSYVMLLKSCPVKCTMSLRPSWTTQKINSDWKCQKYLPNDFATLWISSCMFAALGIL